MNEALWYTARGTGIVALVLLTVSVALGVVVRSRQPLGGLPRYGVPLVHRTASLTATSLIGVHMVTLLLDPYAQLHLVDLAVPFLGTYRPVWLGLGTLAVDILAAIVITSLLRKRIGQRAFRAVHWATYALWPLAFVHALKTGTDAGSVWFLLLAFACAIVIAAAVAWRGSDSFATPRRTTATRA
jgi:sulfoxide reductase heme-binding subunit YedZ